MKKLVIHREPVPLPEDQPFHEDVPQPQDEPIPDPHPELQ